LHFLLGALVATKRLSTGNFADETIGIVF
jgi:hypothetical protein